MSNDKVHVHVDLTESSLSEQGPEQCTECKVELESGFGLAGGGYGAYTFCPQCGKMYSKVQVHD